MNLTDSDKLALKITLATWIVCGMLYWFLRFPAILLIAVGVSWVCGQAVMRVTHGNVERSAGHRDETPE